MAFNRAYSVGNAKDFEAYATPSGTAMIRHYSLNEDMLREDPKGQKLDRLGYSVADFERAGPYIMLAEAQAMANGNPTHLGYLASNNFNRTFPEYVRAFNAAFLSLPALPANIVEKASSDPEVVVRQIDGGKHGTWLAIVNPTYHAKKEVNITLPQPGQVTNAATGEKLSRQGDTLTLDLYPCQLVSLHLP